MAKDFMDYLLHNQLTESLFLKTLIEKFTRKLLQSCQEYKETVIKTGDSYPAPVLDYPQENTFLL
jgi:hypothetical protein